MRTNIKECMNMVGGQPNAYVTPGQKNKKGQYVINICPRAIKVPPGCKLCIIGTVVHEATHHPAAALGDYTYTTPKKLTHAEALNNAENLQYFIRDVSGNL